jgi:hypothetical protein
LHIVEGLVTLNRALYHGAGGPALEVDPLGTDVVSCPEGAGDGAATDGLGASIRQRRGR